MKIGLIQTRGIGDIIIALPIARYFADRGHTVLWPVDARFISSFQATAPYVEFIPVPYDGPTWQYFFGQPRELLQQHACDRIIPLYSHLSSPDPASPSFAPASPRLAASLKFDEYKYAVAGVPFREKWNLQIVRDHQREDRLFSEVAGDDEYVVCHLEGSGVVANLDIAALAAGRRIVKVTPRTDNVFDWLATIERAALRVMIDSCFSNLVDQLMIPGPKIFIDRSPIAFAPVLLGDWLRRQG